MAQKQSPNVVHAAVVEFFSDPGMVMVCLCWGAVLYALYIQFCDFQDNLRIEYERRATEQRYDHEEKKLIEKTAIFNEITRHFNAEIVELKQILEATPDALVPEEATTVENSDDDTTEESVTEEATVAVEENSVDATTEVSVPEEADVEEADNASTDLPVEKTEEVIPDVLAGDLDQACFKSCSCIPDAVKPEPTPADLPREGSNSDFVFIDHQKFH